MEYQEIPRNGDERSTLLAFLEWQREHARAEVRGPRRRSAAHPARRSLRPCRCSGWCGTWPTSSVAGSGARSPARRSTDRYSTDDDPDGDFDNVDTADVEEAFASWREECGLADEIISRRALDATGHQRTGREVSMRWILNHMIEEYSRHNGHADLLRERIDGATGYD